MNIPFDPYNNASVIASKDLTEEANKDKLMMMRNQSRGGKNATDQQQVLHGANGLELEFNPAGCQWSFSAGSECSSSAQRQPSPTPEMRSTVTMQVHQKMRTSHEILKEM